MAGVAVVFGVVVVGGGVVVVFVGVVDDSKF